MTTTNMNDWITVTEAVKLTGKAESTIRRFTSEHKKEANIIKKQNGKMLINVKILNEFYAVANDNQKATATDEVKHKKEAMQIAYNSESIKAQIEQIKTKDEHLKAKDKQIEQLIHKKSYLPLYVTIGFIILFIFLGFISYYLFKEYKLELIINQKSKIVDISANHQKEVKILKDQLIDTRKTYSVLIKEIKDTNNKLTDIQSKTIDRKEKEIERLQKELDKINLKDSTDTDKT